MNCNPNNPIFMRRRARGWTQNQLADMLGVNRVTVSAWEHGRYRPCLKYAAKLAELFLCRQSAFMKPEEGEGVIFERRRMLGLSRPRAARRIGCSITTLERWEIDGVQPSAKKLRAIAAVLGGSPADYVKEVDT